MNIIKITSTLFLFLFLSSTLLSQSSEGTDFWFGFMEHRDNGVNSKVVMITSKTNTSGTISVPLQNFSEDFTVSANQVTLINLPAFTEVEGSEFIQDKGIHLTSEEPVTVYIHQYHQLRSEATLVLPTNVQGMNYYIMTYEGIEHNSGTFRSEFMVIATEDETTVNITLSDATREGMPAGSTVDDLVLNKGEVYQIQGLKGTSDLTGTRITSDKPIAVLAGAEWAEVPIGCSARDNLLEMMFPIETWGQIFVTQPFAGSSSSRYRIMAAEDNTSLTIDGFPSLTSLNAGEFSEFTVDVPLFINADKPILVAQYILGFQCTNSTNGDPSMVLLNSIEQTRDTVTLYNSSLEDIFENYINIAMRTEDVPFITLDGTPIENLGTASEINDEFSYITLAVSAGSHTIISEGCGVIATCYGLGNAESYAYSGGASFSPINANPIPEGSCLNEEIIFDTGLPEGRYSLEWTLGDGTETTEFSFVHTYPGLGTYPAELVIFDECLNTYDTINRDLQVTLRQEVDALDFIASCEGESFSLEATDVGNARYEWTGPNNYFSEEQFPVFNNPSPAVSGDYNVIGIVFGCATFPVTTTVEIYPNPQPNLGEEGLFCSDQETFTIDAGVYNSYLWSNGSTSSTIDIDEENTYTVTVTDENNCIGTDSILVSDVCPTFVFVPNAFSPNFDGINDKFEVQGRNILSLKMSIYDRWGELIFYSNEMDASWDGTFRNQALPDGIYVYVIEVEGYDFSGAIYNELLKGDVSILK
jgi:gliding motility-associated-like protein